MSNINASQTVAEARLVSNAGVTVITIGIGLSDTSEIESIASQPRFVINVDSFDDLEELALTMATPLCTGSCRFSDHTLSGDFW